MQNSHGHGPWIPGSHTNGAMTPSRILASCRGLPRAFWPRWGADNRGSARPTVAGRSKGSTAGSAPPRKKLAAFGFHIVAVEVDRIFDESPEQVLFGCKEAARQSRHRCAAGIHRVTVCCARWNFGYVGLAPAGWVLCLRRTGHSGPHLCHTGQPPPESAAIELRHQWDNAKAWNGPRDADKINRAPVG